MSLSSSSLIHFTNKKTVLKNILLNNFELSYCLENFQLNGRTVNFHVPMVSFCDIPLSNIKNHIKSYGSYGIGLTKEWAEKNKLNPVLYIGNNSSLENSYSNIYKKYILATKKDLLSIDDNEKSIIDILRYMKPYQNDLYRQGKLSKKDYRFSDEREWRYVLDYNHKDILFINGDKDFDKVEANKKLKEVTLNFEPNDIKYIIIKNETEIQEFINLLRAKKGKDYSVHDIERLTTRLITVEQINNDF